MFIFSLSTKKISKKLIFFSVIAVLAVVMVLFVLINHNNKSDTIKYDGGSYTVKAESVSDMSKFLKQFGWQINLQPIEVSKIIIPSEFNEIYEHYNDIQKTQGLDLSEYKGTECLKYCFEILNYPDNEDVIATLIVYDGRVIGGDISETIMGGFIKNFMNV